MDSSKEFLKKCVRFFWQNNDVTPFYLKVDIEGSEYQLFNSINKNVLKGRVEKIAIEYHWSYNNESQSIIDKLKKCGHVVYSFETNSVNKCGKP